VQASAEIAPVEGPVDRESTLLRGFRESRSLQFGSALLVLIAGACIVVPAIAGGAVDQIGTPFQAPSLAHPFGTDEVGRDVLLRTLAGGRIDLTIAVAGVALAVCVGTLVGITAGMSGRWIDAVMMRVVDAVVAFPFIVFVLLLVIVIGARSMGPIPTGIPAIFIALVATDWAWYARIARTQTVSLRSRDFVVAARLLGFSRWRIATRHVAPTVLRVSIAYAAGDLLLFMVGTAGLAFLGAGVEPPTPEWGSIMQEGEIYLQSAWWITIMPAIVLALTGLAVTLISDALLARLEASK
jgi:peptide/nickel transport system permease protein